MTHDELNTLMRDVVTEETEERFDTLEAMLRDIDHSIRGNGKPGLNQRVATLEQSRDTHSKLWSALLGIAVTVVGAILVKVVG